MSTLGKIMESRELKRSLTPIVYVIHESTPEGFPWVLFKVTASTPAVTRDHGAHFAHTGTHYFA